MDEIAEVNIPLFSTKIRRIQTVELKNVLLDELIAINYDKGRN